MSCRSHEQRHTQAQGTLPAKRISAFAQRLAMLLEEEMGLLHDVWLRRQVSCGLTACSVRPRVRLLSSNQTKPNKYWRNPFDSGASRACCPVKSRIFSAPGSPIPGKDRSARFALSTGPRITASRSPPNCSSAIRGTFSEFDRECAFEDAPRGDALKGRRLGCHDHLWSRADRARLSSSKASRRRAGGAR